jgi:histidinol dehydrogenase
MLRTIDVRGRELTTAQWLAAVPRAQAARAEALQAAFEIVDDVRLRGERRCASRRRASIASRITPSVPAAHLDEALESLDPRSARDRGDDPPRAASLGRPGSGSARPRSSRRARRTALAACPPRGCLRARRKAVYPSSVVMNVVPAQVAGVGEIALASPPQADAGGRVHPTSSRPRDSSA